MNNKKKLRGFTLVELMITVAILGILSSIAVPSYMTYVKKSKRTEAKTELLRISQLQESYYIQNLTYAQELNLGLGFASTQIDTESELYQIRSQGLPVGCNGTNANPCTGYRNLATPKIGKGQDNDANCTELYIDNTGRKGAKSTTDTNAFSATNIKECWG